MHPEIQALAQAHHFTSAATRDLDALLTRLFGGSMAPTLVDDASIDLPEPEGIDAMFMAQEHTDHAAAEMGSIPARYEDVGLLGVGGMGEVRRVRDRGLGRTCAYKSILADRMGKPHLVARFLEEAQIGAQLQHPNIPPVYEGGRLPDGRPWFTMKEIRGRTFAEHIRDAHRSEPTDSVLHRLCGVLAQVCDAVGYAHGRGVVHRDLKPENVMVGPYGEVYVVDWGLAKVVGRPDRAVMWDVPEPEVETERSTDQSMRTRVGGVMGTPAYMPPEQARGQVDQLDARADVYALGAMLYELLSGRPPYQGWDAQAVLNQVLAGPPPPPGRTRGASRATFTFGATDIEEAPIGVALPEELLALCTTCLSRHPADRLADGTAVAAALRAWLDGASKRATALEIVVEADALVAEADALRTRAVALRAEGDALLAPIASWKPEAEKAAGWQMQDEADRVRRQAALLELRREALLRGALTHAPDLTEGHTALVELELERHQAAEGVRDEDVVAQAEARLRIHTDALPPGHPVRSRAAAYLRGDGALSLHTDLPGAEVFLARHELRNRRLVEVPVRSLGHTPLRSVPLPMGSYMCRLRHPDRAEVRYPVKIGRGEHWDGVPPGERNSLPIRLPEHNELGPNDCLVPAGWCWIGGDPDALDSLPRHRVWCDAFVMKRFPVTNREFISFLSDLVTNGREAEALGFQPRERATGEGAPVYGRDEAGRFILQRDADGDLWDPDWPVILVDWFAANAYAKWLAATTGRPWRLPGELEWEKSARGVDGRFHPWGDFFDPSWGCIRGSQIRPMPQIVDSFPVDSSVYGVRGLAGNVEDWCADTFKRFGWDFTHRTVSLPRNDILGEGLDRRNRRGGHAGNSIQGGRSAVRNSAGPGFRHEALGFRIAYRFAPTPHHG